MEKETRHFSHVPSQLWLVIFFSNSLVYNFHSLFSLHFLSLYLPFIYLLIYFHFVYLFIFCISWNEARVFLFSVLKE